MAENSKIQWTTHTFNPWRGCTKVSAGCAHCYADTQSKRNSKTLGIWGPYGTRVVASEAMWREPIKWNEKAEFVDELWQAIGGKSGQPGSIRRDDGSTAVYAGRPRVFCASMADVFEEWGGDMVDSSGAILNKDFIRSPRQETCRIRLTMQDVRNRLFSVIAQTPNLDWLLLTKRPENVVKMLPRTQPFYEREGLHELRSDGVPYLFDNIWLGTSVEDQKSADQRIPHLLRVPAKVRFLSVEPLLGPVDLSKWLLSPGRARVLCECGSDRWSGHGPCGKCGRKYTPQIHWVIIGGESGPNARPCRVEWIRDIVRQCKAAGVPVFVKQLGSNPYEQTYPLRGIMPLNLNDPKGGDMAEWPEDLRIREFPMVSQ